MTTELSDARVKALLLIAAAASPPAPPYAALLAQATRPETSVQELSANKETAKALLHSAVDRRHRDAATLLYHASVVAAYVHHGAAISGRPMHKQRELYERFAEAWAGRPLGALFDDALLRMAAAEPDA